MIGLTFWEVVAAVCLGNLVMVVVGAVLNYVGSRVLSAWGDSR